MTTRHAVRTFVLCICSVGAVAAESPPDGTLIQLCIAEIESRQGPDPSHGTPTVVSADVEREELQQVVRVQLSYAEGRLAGGQCIIRDGQVFDFKD